LRTRSSRPRSCPWALSVEAEQAILTARAKTNWGPMRLTYLTGRHRSTVWKVLARHGVSHRRRSQPRQSTRRYEWAEAGALLHIDAFELPKFEVPGHWATGERAEQHKTRRAGAVKVIGVIDDHTRLAYCELHGAENKHTVSATLRRAADWMREQGCGPVQAVMSDNAKCYATSHEFRDVLAELGARHILIPPYTPRWNGKIERFFGTLDTEWAHGRVWPNSTRRDRALASFIRFYNRRRPHSAAGGRPPISRVHQVRGHDT
jgi:transposase InsO family protein